MYAAVRLKNWVFAAAAALLLGIAAGGLAKAYSPVAAAAPVQEGVALPVVMYHGMLKDPAMQGEYVISPSLFESDLQYLQENGYATVHIEDLIRYVDEGKPLPEKPVLLTFDDGYYNNYLYAYPLAQKYHSKIVIAPIGYYTDKFSETVDEHATYSHITWEEIREMKESGLVEFQNHTYNLHASSGGRLGAKKLKSESDEEYEQLLTEDLTAMQNKMAVHTGQAPTCFVYPFGAISESAPAIVRQLGFRCTLTCESRMNYITPDKECLYGLGRWRRTSNQSSAEFFEKILSNP